MRKRILIGSALTLTLALLVLGDLAIGYPALGTVVILVMVLASEFELLDMMRRARPGPVGLVLGATVAMFGARAWLARDGRDPGEFELGLLVGAVLLILARGVWKLHRGGEAVREACAHEAAAGVFALGYIALPMGYLQLMMLGRPDGRGTLFAALLVIISKGGDIGGYLVGTLVGRHRVFPNVSPKKSYEGSLGGLALTLALAAAARASFPDFFPGWGWGALAAFAVAVNLATQAGDFAESMVKRSCGTKDSAALLPTFGGALDIIDSLVFAVPVAYFCFWIIT